jgi:ribosome-interacting GTPase 1
MRGQCNSIHKTIVEQFRQAIVYGKSVKHQPQRVGLSHELADEDISKFTARQNVTCVGHSSAANG